MAEGPDRESRTEQATEKRLQDAIEKGQAPVAQLPGLATFLLALMGGLAILNSHASHDLVAHLGLLLQGAGDIRLKSSGDVQVLLRASGHAALGTTLQFVGPIALLAVVVSFAQTRVLFASSRIAPKWSRLSPGAGWKRIVSGTNLQEFLKNLLKLCLVTGFALAAARANWSQAVTLLIQDPVHIPDRITSILLWLLVYLVAAVVMFAVLDVLLVRGMWHRSLRMTRQEVRDESKDAQGDPQLSARRRAMARRRIKNRLQTTVPRANLVITNPTHFAVALRYVRAEGGAPIVVAKGQDHMALSIRRIAERHNIPRVENKALARALYEQVKVEQRIPAAFYRAVADILIVLRKQGRHNLGQ